MLEELIDVFKINTEAIATNRGFYYQYLLVLKKWVHNFINNIELKTAVEVEDDITEFGNEIIFTQVKCYTSAFSLNSKEVKNALFNFYIIFLKYGGVKGPTAFCFSTNSKIAKREKLLASWIKDKGFEDKEILTQCVRKINEILLKEIKNRRNKLLQRGIPEPDKLIINNASQTFKNSLTEANILSFVKKIKWDFKDLTPENGVNTLTHEIHDLLADNKFNGRSPELLFKVLISEIYNKSQKENRKERELDGKQLEAIIDKTEEDLSGLVNDRIVKLFGIEMDELRANVESLIKSSDAHSKEILFLKDELRKSSVDGIKYLNLVPDFSSLNIIGWDDFLHQVNSILVEKKMVSVYSEGGMGKTSFAKKYLQTFDFYDHIIWVNAESSIPTSLLFDDVLLANINFFDSSGSEDMMNSYKRLLNHLNKIHGTNLIIVDIQETKKEVEEILSLNLTPNWHKLILTRSHLKTIPSERLPNLDFKLAKEVYMAYGNQDQMGTELLEDFFNAIDYNVLVIELVSKTIANSIDLSLSDFVDSLQQQALNKNQLQIDIDIRGSGGSIQIFSYLLERFKLPMLDENEMNYLQFLAILPSNNIIIEDLILMNGIPYYEENKVHINNVTISLEKKGLITISDDRKRIDIHKMVREVINYNQREQISPFVSNFLFINWLTRRIEEGYYSPKNSFRYLKYADSILDTIKEEYRSSLYQPLILLENELFYAKRFYFGAKNHLPQLIDLARRAENFSSLNKNSLGVIYNNLGLCYAENDEDDLAVIYFNKALESYTRENKKTADLIITTLNNLSNIHLRNKDLSNAIKNFNMVQGLRKKYSLYNDQQLGMEFRILSRSYAIAGSFDEAIRLMESGVRLHKSIDDSHRNDFLLASYHNELSHLYLVIGKVDKAVENQEKGVEIIEGMGLTGSSYLLSMYRISENLYKYLGLDKKEREMQRKIELLTTHHI
ncbi:MAG: hypothetical protein CMH46_10425 [Muricauda sp.]|nr:tetratricopeptide repeat protein [Allomuricauda sp.]MAU15939.1 hypothetical protein [Allomuricauda sp.]|tara:strand:- start:4645 stop:7506 length:2862 start_codon:yes stop_codon:yes gene_type:complete